MNALFLKIINMSISASWLVLAVLVIRLVLKKAPKWVNVLLWGIVAVRLICPFSFESALSLIPSTETVPNKVLSGSGFEVQTGIDVVDSQINGYLGDRFFEMINAPIQNSFSTISIFVTIWNVGIWALLLYSAISYLRLYRKLDTAVLYKNNIYQSENVSSPFVLGIIKPRIYLPFKMNGRDLEHVVAHEQAHIRRKDHWWKPFGFLLLIIHWFNPIMWLSYVLLCRDIELACDEKVIKELGNGQRADYTQALVNCSVNRRMIAVCPLAFGEVGVKERVKSIMNYKKPTFWIVLLAIIICIVVAVCFLTDPVNDSNESQEDIVEIKGMTSEISQQTNQETENTLADENVHDELVRVVSSVGLENAYPWNNTVELKSNANALIKMATDETGRFEIYGIMSAKYGTYGLLMNDSIGEQEHWNFAYVPWIYSGAPSQQPILESDGKGKYKFAYIYKYEDEVVWWNECILDCGYDSGHMGLLSKEEYKERQDVTENAMDRVALVDNNKVSSILVINGNTGERKTLTQNDDYYSYFDLMKLYSQLDFTAPYEENSRVGYQYSMRLLDADENKLQSVTPYKDGVTIDGIFYQYNNTNNGDGVAASLRLIEHLEYIMNSE